MSKLLAALVAGLFAAGAYAQNPPGASAEQAPVTNTPGQAKAQAKRDAKPQGQVKQAGGDINKTPEGGAVGTDKAAQSGEKRAETRDQRRRNKDGSMKRRSTQGGTPQ
ncbi:Uncharacterised protein [Xylophilus ampelinus]|nr:cell envelope biogenesis protein TolA [Variovorax sp.]VTY33271.1 Uncharacterised protein [Xylophilus ampelinus]